MEYKRKIIVYGDYFAEFYDKQISSVKKQNKLCTQPCADGRAYPFQILSKHRYRFGTF